MRKHRWLYALFGVLIICIVGIVLFCYNSVGVWLQCARYYCDTSRIEKAQRCLEQAYELDPTELDVLFLLADIYCEKNNKMEYEFYLREIIKNPSVTKEQLENVYSRLIAIYKERKDYETINQILSGPDAAGMQSLFQKFTASAPQFTVNSGTYDTVQYLKMTSVGNGSIYYTLDGTTPTQMSILYYTPIVLDGGDYFVKAVFINEYGVSSEVANGEYHIVSSSVEAPRLSVDSGEYTYPVDIEVLDEDDDNIFYTVNGINPTEESIEYSGSIPIPLGDSEFRFARIVDGVRSEIVILQLSFSLDTDYSPEMAVQDLVQRLIDSGKLQDEEGNNQTSVDRYRYSYSYVKQLGETGIFYIITEELLDEEGQLTRTGTLYAVDVYTGEIFRLVEGDFDQFELISIETN